MADAQRDKYLSQESIVKLGLEPVNPYTIGFGFVKYRLEKGWLIQQGKGRTSRNFSTQKGILELEKINICI